MFCFHFISFGLLTAKERIVTKNAQAAKNHCTLQISFEVSLKPAKIMITDVGIKMLLIIKSANATLTINALPGKKFVNCVCVCVYIYAYNFISKTFNYVIKFNARIKLMMSTNQESDKKIYRKGVVKTSNIDGSKR